MPTSLKQRVSPSPNFSPLAAVVVAVGLLAAGLGMAMYNENLGKTEKLRDVTVQANILAGGVSAALAFDDAKLAQEYLDALGANHDVEAAGVYDLGGVLLAGYGRPGASPPAANSPHAPVVNGDDIIVSQPVVQGDARLGSVYMRTVREPLARRVARYAGFGLLVVMAALVVVVLGASNASLAEAHRKLKAEMRERARTEAALRRSRELEAAAQMEIAAQRSREALRHSERQLEFALHAGRLGSWSLELATDRLTASEFFRANFGLSPDSPLQKAGDLAPYIHPDDRDAQIQAREQAVREGTDLETEFRTLSPTGEVRWIHVRGQAVYDEAGAATRITGVSLDITARKAAEERQRLLLDELNHRVKNTLATVQSIAIQTGQGVNGTAGFNAAFQARLGALSRVHDLLSQASWDGASLADIVKQTLAPYLEIDGCGERLALGGPQVRLGPNAAVTLTMAFHELATNAAKYGSLSTPAGRVEVGWKVDDPAAPSLVEVVWRESGGPAIVSKPSRRGFGSRFIERGLAREFDGVVDLDFAPTGVRCHMRIPLSAKLRMAA